VGVGGRESRAAVVLGIGQAQGFRHERGVQGAPFVPPFGRIGADQDAAGGVVEKEVGVDGVEAVDIGEDAPQPVEIGRTQAGFGEPAAEIRGERPPAAIVGPLVEVAVHDVDGERGEKAHVVQPRGGHEL